MSSPNARTTDPRTSHLAAAEVDDHPVVRPGTQKHRLLAVYADVGPMTADAACERTGLVRGGWKRVSDLTNAGYLQPTGIERRTSSGRLGRLLEITAAGQAVLDGLRRSA